MTTKRKNRPIYLLLLPFLGFFQVAAAQATLTPVDLELSLVTDISGSVNSSEFNLMLDGYTSAFQSANVQNAIGSGAFGAIAVNVVFFESFASEGLGFRLIDSDVSANAFATEVSNLVRSGSGGTNIGSGIQLATTLINSNSFEGTRKVIDVAADGSGGASAEVSDAAIAAGINTINAIAINDPSGSLEQTFKDTVIAGPGAFSVTANSFEDFQPEIERKLIAEIIGEPVDGAPVLAAARQGNIFAVRQMFSDVNSRLLRARANYRRPQTTGFAAMSGTAHEEAAMMAVDSRSEKKKFEFFGSVHVNKAEFDQQTGTAAGGAVLIELPASEVDLFGGTVGLEYDVNNRWSVGGALMGVDGKVDLSNGFGDAEFEEVGAAAYVSYYGDNQFSILDKPTDFWVTAMAGASWGEHDLSRRTTTGVARADTNTTSLILEVSGGLNRQDGALTHGPIASIFHMNGEFDDYTEVGPGAQSVSGPDYTSTKGSVGYQGSYYTDLGFGLLVPQVRASVEHEFRNDDTAVAGVTLGGAPDDTVGVLGLGVLWEVNDNVNVVADYEGRYGSDTEIHRVVVRVGIPF